MPDIAIISVGARTCEECIPHCAQQAGSDSKSTLVKTWWTTGSDTPPHWEIAHTSSGGRFRYDKIGPSDDTIEPNKGNINTFAWKESVIKSGTADWTFLGKTWRPEHCATIEALATAIDAMWKLIAPTARIVIRLTGLSSTIALVLAEVVAQQSLAQEEHRPIAALGRALREVGVAACAGTANIDCCRSIRLLLGEIPECPTEQTVEQLRTRNAIATLASAIAVPPPSPSSPVSAPLPLMPTGGLHRSRLKLLRLGEAPTRPATFGAP